MEFQQKVIILTGASSGIGEVCALKLAKAGGLLSLVGRNLNNLKKVTSECAKLSGKQPLLVIGDISVSEDVEQIVHKTLAHYGKIDVLVNNAGIMFPGGISTDVSDLDKMMATNIRGTYLLTQKCTPHLIETKGNIVTVSSVASTIAEPMLTPYSMTKAALDSLTRCIAAELGPKGVRVNSVNPGPILTNLFTTGGLPESVCKSKMEAFTQYSALRRTSECDDVANLVMFLASDKANCITGGFHYVDAGLHLGAPSLCL